MLLKKGFSDWFGKTWTRCLKNIFSQCEVGWEGTCLVGWWFLSCSFFLEPVNLFVVVVKLVTLEIRTELKTADPEQNSEQLASQAGDGH
jgi:hypothetical protein